MSERKVVMSVREEGSIMIYSDWIKDSIIASVETLSLVPYIRLCLADLVIGLYVGCCSLLSLTLSCATVS